MKRITIDLTEEQYNKVQTVAEKTDIPLSDYTTMALLLYPEKVIENIELKLRIAILKKQENKNENYND